MLIAQHNYRHIHWICDPVADSRAWEAVAQIAGSAICLKQAILLRGESVM